MVNAPRQATSSLAPIVASERVASELRSLILSGELLPGTRIRQEQIAAQLNASRLPVREALRMLESEGLVTLRANSGAWVSRLDLQECHALYLIRERVEPLALAASIPFLTSRDHAELEALQKDIEHATDTETFLLLDRELHKLTYSGCPTELLASMVTRFWNTTQHYRRAYIRITGTERQWVVNSEHRLLIDAIKRRNTGDAERILSGHIRRTREELEHHPEVFDSGDLVENGYPASRRY
jgi:DNA-binding GntR family transcriptional regulator